MTPVKESRMRIRNFPLLCFLVSKPGRQLECAPFCEIQLGLVFADTSGHVRSPASFATQDPSEFLDNFPGLKRSGQGRIHGDQKMHESRAGAEQDRDSVESFRLKQVRHGLELIG